MAGGEGRRLRPLTSAVPKPLAEIGGIPVIERIFRLISIHDVDEAAVTVRYLGNMIEERFGNEYSFIENGKKYGVKLKYFTEERPLGTAGGVKNAEEIYAAEDQFLVISGDAVTDLDITDMLKFHKKSNADVTIAVSTAEDPREYGTIVCNEDGMITRFVEKPSWQQVVTDCVNTGIYIISSEVMSTIQSGTNIDFSKDVFPCLLKTGGRLFAYETECHWCDIGSLTDYYAENMFISHGENVFSSDGNIDVSDEAHVCSSVIGHDVSIGNGTFIKKSVICSHTQIGNNVDIGYGCVVGAECIIEDDVVIVPNSKIEAGSKITSGTMNGFEGRAFSYEFDTDGLMCCANPVSCAGLGISVAEAAGCGKRIAVLCGETQTEKNAADAVLCGLCYGGCRPYNFGVGFEAMAYFAAVKLGMDYTIFLRAVRDDEGLDGECVKVHAEFFDINGLHPERGFESKLSSSLGTMKERKKGTVYSSENCGDLESLYSASLRKEAFFVHQKKDISMPLISLRGKPSGVLENVLEEMGFCITNSEDADIVFNINDRGDSVTVHWSGCNLQDVSDDVCLNSSSSTEKSRFQYNKSPVDMWHLTALLVREEFKNSERHCFAIPSTAPIGLDKIMKGDNITVVKYLSCPSDGTDIDARYLAGNMLWMRDACLVCVKLCKLIAQNGKISDIMATVPQFFFSEKNMRISGKNGASLMKKLGVPCDEGIRIDYRDGSVVRVISNSADTLKIIADASSAEVADELVQLSSENIKRLLED